MRFSRQEYWSGLPCTPPGAHPDTGIELESPALAGRFFNTVPQVYTGCNVFKDSRKFRRDINDSRVRTAALELLTFEELSSSLWVVISLKFTMDKSVNFF